MKQMSFSSLLSGKLFTGIYNCIQIINNIKCNICCLIKRSFKALVSTNNYFSIISSLFYKTIEIGVNILRFLPNDKHNKT